MRALSDLGINAMGIDAVPGLIARASALGGSFTQMSYREFAEGKWGRKVDCVVCNFSLLGNEIVADVLHAIVDTLTTQGCCIIQTLHPNYSGEPYCDGWREGSWAGFSDEFTDPAPGISERCHHGLACFRTSGYIFEKCWSRLTTRQGSRRR